MTDTDARHDRSIYYPLTPRTIAKLGKRYPEILDNPIVGWIKNADGTARAVDLDLAMTVVGGILTPIIARHLQVECE